MTIKRYRAKGKVMFNKYQRQFRRPIGIKTTKYEGYSFVTVLLTSYACTIGNRTFETFVKHIFETSVPHWQI